MPRITDEKKSLAIAMCRDGKTRNHIAKTLGIAAGSVSKIAADAGLSFDRDQIRAATEARTADLREKRSQLENLYLDDALRLRALVWQPMTYRDLGRFADEKGEGGSGGRQWSEYVEYRQDTPTPQDQRTLMLASTTAATASQRLADAAADQNTEQAKSMLTQLMVGLGEAWRETQAADQ